jgi:hypothetical protein
MRRRSLVVSLSLFVTLWAAGPASGSVFDLLPEVVQGMPRAPGDGSGGTRRTVTVNGFPMHLSTGRTERPVEAVLDYYEARYQGGAMKDVLGRPFSLRRGGPEQGMLLSVEVPDQATAKQVVNLERPFLSAGPLRMVQARRRGLQTDYLTVWSEKPLPESFFRDGRDGQGGDAPGADVPGVPRPQGRRTLSFSEPKAGYTLVIYEVNESADWALQRAAASLSGAGFNQDMGFAGAARKQGRQSVRFSKGGRDVVITARSIREGREGRGGGTQLIYLTRDLS